MVKKNILSRVEKTSIIPLYDGLTRDEWSAELDETSEWVSRHAMCAFALLGRPATLWDIGCGNGTLVNVARRLGILAFGVDQLVDETWGPDFFHHNLVDPFTHEAKAEQVYCLEVAEHIHESAHATLCDSLVGQLKQGSGNFLIFSSAFPNQGGMGHVAERPAKYWLDQFSLRNLNYRKDITINLSLLWNSIGSPLYWLPMNVMVFEK